MSAKLEEGTVFAGRYRVIRCLAAGGMGAVYEAIHLETDRRRALKVMHPHLFQSEDMRERFKREARIAAQVDSEYIVDVSDAGVDEATQMPFLVMELLRGEELGDRLKRMGHLPPEEVVTYIQQTAWALDRTHAASIVHRDLKPANLFLTTREDGTPRIKILDFGVAKLVADGATAAGATQSLGTPIYMAPEQFRTNTKLTAAADIYALTLMTYTLLVGEAYWAEEARSAGDVIAFAIAALNGPQESAVQRAARRSVILPSGFDAWFAKGTAVNPAERFSTATEAVRALRAVGSSPSSGVVPMTVMPVMAPNTELSPPARRPTVPSDAMVDRATRSTGASTIKDTPVERSRVPFLTGAVVLGLMMIGLGAWLTLRPTPSSQKGLAALEMSSAAPAAIPAPEASSATPAAIPAPEASSAAPATIPSAPDGSSAGPAATPPAPPGAGSAAPATAPPAPVKEGATAAPASTALSAGTPGPKLTNKSVSPAPGAQSAPPRKTVPPTASAKNPLQSTPLLSRD